MADNDELTSICTALTEPNRRGLDQWLPLVYNELRGLAEGYLRHERPDHTLQATALVHEAYERMARAGNDTWHDRAHFFRVAAKTMRRILINHAHRHRANKRGGGRQRLLLEEITVALPRTDIDLVALDEALEALAANDARKAAVVELRFFAGCTAEETAEALSVSTRTIEREWRFAQAWLQAALADEEEPV